MRDFLPASLDGKAVLTASVRTLATVVLGTLGGIAAMEVGLPLPWILGPILVIGIIGIAGLELRGHAVHVPLWLRTAMIPVIAVMLGSRFTPQVVAGMAAWWITMLALMAFILAATALTYQFYRRVYGFDPITAYFSSVPGGLIDMAIIGEGQGGDGRTISLVHFCRIMFSVMTIPFLLQWLYGGGAPHDSVPAHEGVELALVDIGLMIACAVAGYFGGKALRLPGAQITGPLMLSAAVHATGLTAASPPEILIILAQIVVGSSLGARFAGVSFRAAGRIMGASLVATALMFAVTMAVALSLAPIVDEPLQALILAYSPGGLAEMSLIALSLDVGVAFVTAHHIARIALAVGIMPAIWQRIAARKTVEARSDRRS